MKITSPSPRRHPDAERRSAARLTLRRGCDIGASRPSTIAVALCAIGLLLSACSSDGESWDAYCAEWEATGDEGAAAYEAWADTISDADGGGDPEEASAEFVEVAQPIADAAPDPIADDWQTVIDAIGDGDLPSLDLLASIQERSVEECG